MWYHTLNCGYRTRLSGETDFPCIYMERVGMGRSYVKLDGPLTYAGWCEGLRRGPQLRGRRAGATSWISAVDGEALGENGSELRLATPGSVGLTVQRRRLSAPAARPGSGAGQCGRSPIGTWSGRALGDPECAGRGRGQRLAGRRAEDHWPTAPYGSSSSTSRSSESSWVALRVLRSSHTNPFFVLVGDKPIRASRRSAEWCLRASTAAGRKSSDSFPPATKRRRPPPTITPARRTGASSANRTPIEGRFSTL